MTDSETPTGFSDLDLIDPVRRALEDVGYETPSPIQAQTIPLILAGKDVLGQAQTGTGKTAAFALPLLSRLDPEARHVQVLVLTPTRELAIQVAEAFQRYAIHMRDFRVLPIYGGQAYDVQLRKLSRGVDVVVGTPGRVMDHMRRGTLKLESLNCLVLDEADEMLRMGFIEDVEWILEKTPSGRQIALFSATIPAAVRRIAQQHLDDPAEVTIKVKTTTADTIRQRFWVVSGFHKLDALTRILEAETFEAMIVFVRTKTATAELAEKLGARGFAAAPISGDISQQMRERTVERLRKGQLDILVATDVAARGLDVDRISHVVNYDIPYDTDSYVHRVGRTGRAGRIGEAILFVAPRERRLLHAIERATRQKIERMDLPSTEVINDRRMILFKQRITDTLAAEEWQSFMPLLEQYQQEHNTPAMEMAAALARLVQGDEPLLLTPQPVRRHSDRDFSDRGPRDRGFRDRGFRDRGGFNDRGFKDRGNDRGPRNYEERDRRPRRPPSQPEVGMERYRVEVGRSHGLQPGNLVGAIANEGGLEGRHIGRIDIFDDHSTVDLPEGMPRDVYKALQATWVSGQKLRISKADGPSGGGHGGGSDRGGGPRGRGPGGPGPRRGPHGGRPGGPGGPRGPKGPKGFGGRDGSQPRKKKGPGGPKRKPRKKF